MADSDPHAVTQGEHGSTAPRADGTHRVSPKHIGRYRIKSVLGDGAFGVVYLAYDQELDRLVALKVPHAKLASSPANAERYLAVARTVANLDHLHIAPIYDVGSTNECPCYVVRRYVEGCDLSPKLQHTRLTYTEAVQLVATLAEALHYAHTAGVIHRNVKPSNILVGEDGTPYLVDFGLVQECVAGVEWRVTGEVPVPTTHHAPPTTQSVPATHHATPVTHHPSPATRHPPPTTRVLNRPAVKDTASMVVAMYACGAECLSRGYAGGAVRAGDQLRHVPR